MSKAWFAKDLPERLRNFCLELITDCAEGQPIDATQKQNPPPQARG